MNNLENPLVSIIMPVYNVGRYIEECLLSVINQTYINIELLIVNDGTKDNSVEIAQKILSGWNGKYKIINQKNGGACSARNNAISQASGDYLLHLDADDKMDDQMISHLISSLRQFNFDPSIISFGKWVALENDHHQVSDCICHNYDIPSDLLCDMYINHVCLYPHCYLVPKQIIEKSGVWDTSLVQDEDGDFFSRAIVQAKRLVYSDSAVAYYRFGNMMSQSKQISEKAINGFVETAIKKARLLLENSNNPRKEEAVLELISLKPKTYYPYFHQVRKKSEKSLRSLVGEYKIDYPAIGFKQWVYYYLVRLGFVKSSLKA